MEESQSMNLEEKSKPEGTQEAQKIKGKQPFRVWFHVTSVPGRSHISPAHPLTYVHEIADKFYSKDSAKVEIDDATLAALQKSYEAGPREKYPEPLLESQRLGWYFDVRFTPVELLRDRRFHFHKRTSEMIKLEARIGNKKNSSR